MLNTLEVDPIKKIEVFWKQGNDEKSAMVPVYKGDTLSDFAQEARKRLEIGDDMDLSLPRDIRNESATKLGDNPIPLDKDGWAATIRGNIVENDGKQQNSIFGHTGKILENKATGKGTQTNTIQNQSQGCCMF